MLIVVVGPSGAGKDSLISYARDRLGADPTILFVRRIVTRAALADAEDHETLSVAAFRESEAMGMFAVAWKAHGLQYAIPRHVRDHLAAGGVAIANGSRAALPAIRAVFGRVVPVHVTCRPEVLAARLAARGREDLDQQQRRLARVATAVETWEDAIEIDNSGDIATAGEAFLAVIREAMRTQAASSGGLAVLAGNSGNLG